jgi:hypothetical protein
MHILHLPLAFFTITVLASHSGYFTSLMTPALRSFFYFVPSTFGFVVGHFPKLLLPRSEAGADPRGGQGGPWPHLNFFNPLYLGLGTQQNK